MQKVGRSINEGKAVRDKLKKAFEEKQQILQKDQRNKFKKGEEDLKKQNLVLSDKAKRKERKGTTREIYAVAAKNDAISKGNFRYGKPV